MNLLLAVLLVLPAPPEVEVLDVTWRITESGPSGSRLSWKALVRNNTWTPATFRLVVEVKDWDGFVLAQDREADLWLSDAETREFAGRVRVSAAMVGSIDEVTAEVERKP